MKCYLLVMCLGPRTLLRVGILVKASSSKTLIAFLFNDLFMLTYPNKRHLRLQFSGNFFHNQKAMESTYTLYRKPLILDEFVIADLPEFEASLDPNMFRIFIKSEKNHITLRANSVNDCVQWLKEIDTAKRHYHEIQQKRNQHQRRVISPSRAPIGHFFLTIIEAVELYSKNCNYPADICSIDVTSNSYPCRLHQRILQGSDRSRVESSLLGV